MTNIEQRLTKLENSQAVSFTILVRRGAQFKRKIIKIAHDYYNQVNNINKKNYVYQHNEPSIEGPIIGKIVKTSKSQQDMNQHSVLLSVNNSTATNISLWLQYWESPNRPSNSRIVVQTIEECTLQLPKNCFILDFSMENHSDDSSGNGLSATSASDQDVARVADQGYQVFSPKTKKLKALKKELETLKQENQRKDELIKKMREILQKASVKFEEDE